LKHGVVLIDRIKLTTTVYSVGLCKTHKYNSSAGAPIGNHIQRVEWARQGWKTPRFFRKRF